MNQRHPVFVALGSNLGERERNIRAALDALAALPDTALLRESALMENPAVDSPAGAGDFLNGAAMLETTLSPEELLEALLEIETKLGRKRGEPGAPRVIDLDLLLYADRVIEQPGLSVPHPRMHEREFVLWPLLQIAPRLIDPRDGKPFADKYAMLR